MRRTATLLLALVLLSGTAADGNAAMAVSGDDTDTVDKIRALPPRAIDEVVWLARCIYSESNRSHEQRLVGWVVRNRVETQFRGDTYRKAVLTPAQFSAFNTSTPRRRRILNLTLDSRRPGWQQALEIAYGVYTASGQKRPFPITTRHFYSPVSMATEHPPEWTENYSPIPSESLGVLPQRFKFYDGVDQQSEAAPVLAQNASSAPATSRYSPPPTGETAEEDKTSLKELRQSIRRRLFRGQVNRPRRPTVQRPSRPEGQQ